MKVGLLYLIHPANSNSHENLGIREISVFLGEFLTCFLHKVSKVKQSKQLLTKEIRVLLEETNIFLHRKEKKCSLFYFMNPDNSSRRL